MRAKTLISGTYSVFSKFEPKHPTALQWDSSGQIILIELTKIYHSVWDLYYIYK